jgi:hypothetical protein
VVVIHILEEVVNIDQVKGDNQLEEGRILMVVDIILVKVDIEVDILLKVDIHKEVVIHNFLEGDRGAMT